MVAEEVIFFSITSTGLSPCSFTHEINALSPPVKSITEAVTPPCKIPATGLPIKSFVILNLVTAWAVS